MSRLSQLGGLFLTLSSYVQCVPFPITEPYQGRLFGSSFGIPGENVTYGGYCSRTIIVLFILLFAVLTTDLYFSKIMLLSEEAMRDSPLQQDWQKLRRLLS